MIPSTKGLSISIIRLVYPFPYFAYTLNMPAKAYSYGASSLAMPRISLRTFSNLDAISSPFLFVFIFRRRKT